MQLAPEFFRQFFDDNGDPLSAGLVYTYAAGGSTPKATYTDQTGNTENANPIVLDSAGRASIWINSDSYKFVVKDSAGTTIRTIDAVSVLGLGSVGTDQLADGAVDTDELADGAVTRAKLAAIAAVTQALTIPSTSSTTAVAATGTANITTTGRPVRVGLVGTEAAGIRAALKVSGPTNVPLLGYVEFLRDGAVIAGQAFGMERPNATNPIEDYDDSGTDSYTVPQTGTIFLKGCGGGGGGSGGGSSGGGGGGGGSSVGPMIPLAVTKGDVLTIVRGAGGTGGSGGSGGSSGVGTAGGETYVELNGTKVYSVLGGNGGGAVADGFTGGTTSHGAGGTGNVFGAAGADGGEDGGTGTASSGGVPTYNPIKTGGAGGSGSSGNSGFGGGGGGGAASEYGDGAAGGNKATSGPATSGATGADATANGAGGGGGGGGDDGQNGAAGGAGGPGRLQIFDSAGISGTAVAYATPSSFSFLDAPSAALHAYTVNVYVNDATTTLDSQGTISLQVLEL